MPQLDLDARPESVPRARRFARDVLAATAAPELRDDVDLLLSELLANVVLHAPGPARVVVEQQTGGVRLEVHDSSATIPVRRVTGTGTTTGRGLNLVAALAESWGVTPRTDGAPGKAVWCLVVPHEPGTDDLEVPDVDLDALLAQFEDAAPGVHVRVGDAPVALVLEAKDHLDGVLREISLAEGSDGLPQEVVGPMAAAARRFAPARTQLRALLTAAIARGDDRVDIVFDLPTELAETGERYLASLAAADDFARDRRMLSLESPVAHRVLREWYVGALVSGLRAAARGDGPVPAETFEARLLRELQVLDEGRREALLGAQLQRVTSLLATEETVPAIARTALAEGMRALGADGGTFARTEHGRTAPVVEVGVDEGLGARYRVLAPAARPLGPSTEALQSAQAVFVEARPERDERYPHLRLLQPEAAAVAALPLVVSGDVVGSMRLSFTTSHVFTEAERTYLAGLAAQSAQAVARADALSRLHELHDELAGLLRDRDRAGHRLGLLDRIGAALTSTLDVDEAMSRLGRLLVPDLADLVTIELRDEDEASGTRTVLSTASEPARAEALLQAERYLPRRDNPHSATYRVLHDGEPLVHAEITAQHLERMSVHPRQLELYLQVGMRDAVVVPLLAHGRVSGCLSLIRTGDNRTPYADADVTVAREIGRRAGLLVDNAAQYTAQRALAEGLQRSLLPELPSLRGLALGAAYEPSSSAAVGGDWYDAFPLVDDGEPGAVGLVIGDVMGHDVSAAASMGQLRSVLRTCAVEGDPPAVVLDRLDRLVSSFAMADLATVVYARLDRTDGGGARLTWANAGHMPPLVLLPDGTSTFLDDGRSTMIGAPRPVTGDVPREQAVRELPAGATLVLFTDGLVDQRGRDLDDQLALLRSTADALRGSVGTPEELCAGLLAALRDPAGADDCAVVALRLLPPGQEPPPPLPGSLTGEDSRQPGGRRSDGAGRGDRRWARTRS